MILLTGGVRGVHPVRLVLAVRGVLVAQQKALVSFRCALLVSALAAWGTAEHGQVVVVELPACHPMRISVLVLSHQDQNRSV
jgi:hypothetical protein